MEVWAELNGCELTSDVTALPDIFANDSTTVERRHYSRCPSGADVLFYEAPASVDEMADAARRFDTPLMANMVEGGATPVLTPGELEALGFQVAIFPASGFLAATEALSRVYGALRDTGASTADGAPLHAFKDFLALMGFDEVLEFERRYD